LLRIEILLINSSPESKFTLNNALLFIVLFRKGAELFGILDHNNYECLKLLFMKTSLTISVEKAVVEKAKSYAKNIGISLSVLVQNHLEYFKGNW